MSKAKMYTYPQSDHSLPHWKCVLRCCANCSYINLTDKETDKTMNKQHPKLGFTFITSLHVVLLMVELHILCRYDYYEWLVSRFANQIQS